MRPICAVVLAILLCSAAARAGATRHTRYLELINQAHDSVISLEVAGEGDDDFRKMPLGTPLHGGGASIMVEVTGESGSCLYDFRFTFRDGRRLIYRDVDVCRYRNLRIRQPSRGMPAGRSTGLSGHKKTPPEAGGAGISGPGLQNR